MSRTSCSTPRLGLSLAIAASAWSACAAPVTTNAPIIITASRVDRTAEELPTQVTIITAEDINKSGAQNVVSALESLGGLYFRHNSDNPGLADISMRGFGQNSHGRVLVLVDGQRLNTADMATLDWLRIPVSSVERIEVLRGGQTESA
jgi:outer membrane cobalamin receptor